MSVKVHEAFSLDSARRRFHFDDHFLGDSIRDLWRDNGAGSSSVIDQQDGGIVRIATSAAVAAQLLDWNNVRSLLVSKNVTMELRAKLTQTTLTQVQFYLMFGAGNTMYFSYDSAASANWFIISRDVGVSSEDSGEVADTDYHIFRIESSPTSVGFYIDGVEVTNSPLTVAANIPNEYLMPRLRIANLEVAIKSMDIDYIVIRQDR